MVGILVAALLSGCAPKRTGFETPWQPADLRALQLHQNDDPDHQLVAAYARLTATDLELRVDFLGSPGPFDYDLYVLVDDRPGGGGQLPVSKGDAAAPQEEMAWDLALGFPGHGLPRAFGPGESPLDVRPRIVRLAVLDAAVVRIQRSRLRNAEQAGFKLLVTRAGEQQVLDSVGPLRVNGPPPTNKASLLLAFWDSLPSATPAQALRRWDGAHTGPYGQRHGLNVLLEAAAQNNIPIAVLDLKRPDRLAALEALGKMAEVRKLRQNGLLILPDVAYGDPRAAQSSLAETDRVSRAYQIGTGLILYGAFEGLPPGRFTAAFYHPDGSTSPDQPILEQDGFRWIPLPAALPEEQEQAGPQGLALPVRRALVEMALAQGDTASPGGLVVLGGSLPVSPWGDSTVAGPVFSYIAGHPWLHALDEDDLLHFPTRPGIPGCADKLCLPASVQTSLLDQARAAVASAPAGVFGELARRTFRSLSDPRADPAESALRAGYLGNVGYLLAAARWEAGSSSGPDLWTECTADLDWDGAAECILASQQIFLILSPADGRLVLAAGRGTGGAFQVVGPRSQLAVGLSDPSEWKPGSGKYADPQETAGGFADRADSFADSGQSAGYQVAETQEELVFTSPDGRVRKRYRLTGDTIEVFFDSSQPMHTELPLVLLDGKSSEPGAYARYTSGPQSNTAWTWSIQGGPAVEIRSVNAELQPQSFSESLGLLKQAEDPNTSYPPGHFIPFRMAVVTMNAQGSFSVVIHIIPPGK